VAGCPPSARFSKARDSIESFAQFNKATVSSKRNAELLLLERHWVTEEQGEDHQSHTDTHTLDI
jgi:hypothetical protein